MRAEERFFSTRLENCPHHPSQAAEAQTREVQRGLDDEPQGRRAHYCGHESGSQANGRAKDIPGRIFTFGADSARDAALSQRIEDLPLLQNHFLHEFAALYRTPCQRLSRRVQMILSRHSWPGNIRELENVIAYCCMISQGDVIEAADLPDYLRNPKVFAGLAEEPELHAISMRRMRLEYVARVLALLLGGNRSHAARISKVGRGTLLRYIKDAGIQ